MHLAFAVLLAVHGIAHLVGFLVPWRLMTSDEMPYSTTLLGGTVDVGGAGIRIVGLGWLLLAGAFLGGAWMVWVGRPGAAAWVTTTALVSVAMCVLGWPQARVGLWVNAAILGAVFASDRIDGLTLLGPG
jgi:hypothetical protein